ncbi:hypothetical protein C8Q79DRAFT_967995 [Trametes meyenii]|nr:hypothetical protein C8Q79DRAFT_967995 [Trametes meyenii]
MVGFSQCGDECVAQAVSGEPCDGSRNNSDCLCNDSAAQAFAFQCISEKCSQSDSVAFGLSNTASI